MGNDKKLYYSKNVCGKMKHLSTPGMILDANSFTSIYLSHTKVHQMAISENPKHK